MKYQYAGGEAWAGPRQKFTFDPGKCGTRKGYRQHQNHGVPLCERCRHAHNTYMNARNQRLRKE